MSVSKICFKKDNGWLIWVLICFCAILNSFTASLWAGPEPKPRLKGDCRTYRVFLDPNQYQQDMTNTIQNGAEDVYETFNIIMRRKPKENNFKVRYHSSTLKPYRWTVILKITETYSF